MRTEFASSARAEAGIVSSGDLLEYQPFCPGCGCRLQRDDPSGSDYAHAIPHGFACRRCRKKVRLEPPLIEIPFEEIPEAANRYWIPSPAEIAAECRKIQTGWSPLEERRRAGQFPVDPNDRNRALQEFRESGDATTWTAPECRNHAF
ncbi:MAG: hypothetical protein KF777_01015 [Planctomycetaceae bacterium]|nr:hypothetical protein [Planctomycetaceae bacterium]